MLLPATRRFLVTCKPASGDGIGPPARVAEDCEPAAAAARRRLGQGAPRATAAGAARAGGCHSTSSAAVRSSDSPYQSGVAVWGPMLTPAVARRASVGASGSPSQHTAGGSADNATPSGRRNRNCPVGVSYHLKALFVHRAVVETTAENQVLQPGLPAVGPVHDVVGVAAAGSCSRGTGTGCDRGPAGRGAGRSGPPASCDRCQGPRPRRRGAAPRGRHRRQGGAQPPCPGADRRPAR